MGEEAIAIRVGLIVGLIVAAGLTIGITRYLVGAGRALETKVRKRAEARAQELQLAILEQEQEVEEARRETERERRLAEEFRSKNRVVVHEIELRSDDPKAVIDELGRLLSTARRSFIASYKQLQRFNRTRVNILDVNRYKIEIDFLMAFTDAFGGLPQIRDIDPSLYKQSASIDLLERWWHHPQARTDETLDSLYSLAHFFKNIRTIGKGWSPMDLLRLFDHNITAALLIVQALKYQLIQFQVQVFIEHIDAENAHEERSIQASKTRKLFENYKEANVEGDGGFAKQRVKIMEKFQDVVEKNRQSPSRSGAHMVALAEDTTKRFEDLLSLEEMLRDLCLRSMEPTTRFTRLEEIGSLMEEDLLPLLATTFGFDPPRANS